MNPFQKVKDSSIWHDSDNLVASTKKDPYIRIGTVLKSQVDEQSSEPKYLVEVRDKNDKIIMWCRVMSRFGGAYNYEEYALRGYTTSPLSSLADSFAAKAGDFVLVVALAGETREGLILGGLKHPARKSTLDPAEGPAYAREFNGIQEKISPEGEYTLTFLGKPVNEAILKAPQSAPIVPPVYNPTITGSYIKFDSGGGIELNDKAVALPQSIMIDKGGGTLTIKSGTNELMFDKNGMATTLATGKLSVDAKVSAEIKTAQLSLEATTTVKIKGLKVAIGSDSVELFDELIKMIDAIGQIQVTSPVGPCTPIMATPQWANIVAIKAKLTAVKGSL